MKIECPRCKTTYAIPDERLPQKERIRFLCKKCGEPIEFVHPILGAKAPSPGFPDNLPSPPENSAADRKAPHDPAKVKALKSKIKMCLMGSIPPLAHVVAKAQMVMSNPFSGLRDLAEVIETDPGITTRALKIANSAYYGLSGEVMSIQHAAVLLGNKILGEIIAVAGARGYLGEKLSGYEIASGVLWRHSLAVAVGAKRIAAQKFPEHAEHAFVAGLLHDTGMIMLDPYILERKETFDEIISEDSVSFLEAERALLGTDHCEMGAEVLREWGIPETLLKSVARHHGPSFSSGPLVCIVHVADIMARKIGFGIRETDDVLYGVDSKALEAIGMQAEDLENFETEIIKATETVAMEVMQETE